MNEKIFEAIQNDDLEYIKKYVEQRKSLNVLDSNGNTPFMKALEINKPLIAQILFSYEQPLLLKNLKQETAYLLSLKISNNEKMTKELREIGILLSNYNNKSLNYIKNKIEYNAIHSFEKQDESYKLNIISREMKSCEEIIYKALYLKKPISIYIYPSYDDQFKYVGGGIVFDYDWSLSLKEQDILNRILLDYEKKFTIGDCEYLELFKNI
jgi:hypothetical protein